MKALEISMDANNKTQASNKNQLKVCSLTSDNFREKKLVKNNHITISFTYSFHKYLRKPKHAIQAQREVLQSQ